MRQSRTLTIICSLLLLTGCARELELKKSDTIPRIYPFKVAVLPFLSTSVSESEGAIVIRREFTANLKDSSLEIIELSVIDAILAKNDLTDPKIIQQTATSDPNRLGELLGASAIITGTVNKWRKQYLLVQSNIEVDATVQMIETFRGETLIEVSKGEIKSAGLSRIPTGYVAAAIAPLLGMQKIYLYKLSHDLSRNLAQPFIYTFSNHRKNPFISTASATLNTTDNTLYTILMGDKNKNAFFSISNRRFPMTETTDGCYIAQYRGVSEKLSRINFILADNSKETSLSIQIK